MKNIMGTETNYLQTLTERVKENVPYSGQLENIIKDNQQFFTVAGGALLTVLGMKFITKTVGFLALVSGVTILYRAAAASPKVVEVMNVIAKPAKAEKELQILQEA